MFITQNFLKLCYNEMSRYFYVMLNKNNTPITAIVATIGMQINVFKLTSVNVCPNVPSIFTNVQVLVCELIFGEL